MVTDYTPVIQDVWRDEIIDTVYLPTFAQLVAINGMEPWLGGTVITDEMQMSWTSNGGSYVKGESNPAPSTGVLKNATWTKGFYHGTAGLHGIDKSNAKNGGTKLATIQREIATEVKKQQNTALGDMFTQIKSDIDASGAYSDASLSRTTYPTLVSYEEGTDTPITLALHRGMVNATTINKEVELSEYLAMYEQSVYNIANPLMGAVNDWVKNDAPAGDGGSTGFQPTRNFEGVDLMIGKGMTTGDVLMLRTQDLKITEHRPLEIEQTDSGADVEQFVIRFGINARVQNPGNQGKMTDKDPA